MAFGGPNQTATPNPVVSFTPQKEYPSLSTLGNQFYTPTTYVNAANNALLVSDVLGGLIIHTTAGAQTDTLPSAALLVPQIEGGQVGVPGIAGSTTGGSGILFYVTAGGAGAITIAAGAGGTLVGSGAIATLSTKQFLLIITALGAAPTYTVYSLGTAGA